MSSAVQMWLDSAGRHPLLTAAEEIHLSTLVQAGMSPDATPGQQRAGRRARERMIKANLRLVVSNSRPLLRRLAKQAALSQEDLLQEGVLGLNRAVDKFNPERGFKFSTYATWWIRQSMTRIIEMQGHGPVRVPISALDVARRWRYRPAGESLEEFCLRWGYRSEQVTETLRLVAQSACCSLDAQARHVDGAGLVLAETVADQDNTDPLAEYDYELAVAALEAALPADLQLVEQQAVLGKRTVDLAAELGLTRNMVGYRTKAARERLAVVGAEFRELVA